MLELKELYESSIADIKEGYRQGGDGPARDDIIINFPWKFNIKDIQIRFDIWQGDKDKNVPLNQGHYQADLLPNSSFHLLKDKGHMLLLDEWKNILIELVR